MSSVLSLEGTLTDTALDTLVSGRNEPDWLTNQRREALSLASTLTVPDWSRGIRSWWSSPAKGFDPQGLNPYAPASPNVPSFADLGEIETEEGDLLPAEDSAGLLVQSNSEVVKVELSEEARSKGVVFISLEDAARQHPDLFKKYFLTRAVKANENKLTALHAAFWTGGAFLYVPDNVEIENPFRVVFHSDAPNYASFSHVLVISGANSRIRVIEENHSTGENGGDKLSLDANIVEVFVGKGGVVEYYNPQELAENVFNFSTKRAMVDKDGIGRWVQATLGSNITLLRLETILVGQGARAESTGAFFPSHEQHFDVITAHKHTVPNTTGDALFKAVLNDAGQYGFQGIIRVEKDCVNIDSLLGDHVLYLSEQSKADALPSLDVESFNVRCAHGQTIGMVDEAQIFYLQSRGLSREEAVAMIVSGFFEQVTDRIPLASIRQRLRDSVSTKIGG